MELLKRALPFVIVLELLLLLTDWAWPRVICPETFWALVAVPPAFLFLNGIFAPVTLRPYDTRPWLEATVPAYWLAMVLHGAVIGLLAGVSLWTTVVGLVVQGMIMLAYITMMARVPTVPARRRHPAFLLLWWLVASTVMLGLWHQGVRLAAAWGVASPEGLALAGGLTVLLYASWNLLRLGVLYWRQPELFQAY
ncbi:MAG TPA: hypothetical protein VIL07_07800 [Symbiobacteriaceae bacterium]